MNKLLVGQLLRISALFCLGLLLTASPDTPPITPQDACQSCPDKCLKDANGGGVCVTCLADQQCQTKTSPTRRCNDNYVCVCGSPADCGPGEQCAQGLCVQCTKDEHCTTSSEPYCVANVCQSCKQGDSRSCTVSSQLQCGQGTQLCRSSGTWGQCTFEKSPPACDQKEQCVEGRCLCRQGYKSCDDVCTNTNTDAKHCGTCGNACPTGTRCASGKCVDTCPSSTPSECGNACVNLQNNPLFCGSCNTSCKPGELCKAGTCTCPSGQESCDGQCIATANNREHCGACSTPCKEGQVCASGACRQTCPKRTPTSCYGGCVDLQINSQHCGTCGTACRDDQLCRAGACVCPDDQLECGGRCVDTKNTLEHCGGCGKPCKEGQRCAEGVCVLSCPSTTPDACYGGCFQLKTSTQHCGTCGTSCAEGQTCNGTCQCPKDLQLCNNECVDTKIHRQHCGKCGNLCKNGQYCSAGKCVSSCPKPTPTNCFGGCVSLQNNPQHCGACGNVCKSGQSCQNGVCDCPTGLSLCDGVCVDLQNNAKHCGQCDTTCRGVEACITGTCVYQGCNPPLRECNRTCINTQNNSQHCGDCDKPCTSGFICKNGACESPCSTGETYCAGTCVDTKTTTAHCGACGQACKATEACTEGVCVSAGCTKDKPTSCATSCADTQSDPNHCGACGNTCKTGEACCSGTCVDTQRAVQHCGMCGNACGAGKDCCAATCVDTQANTAHCGQCGNTCNAQENCCSGTCGAPKTGIKDPCDGKDNDCDGLIDEDCGYAVGFDANVSNPTLHAGRADPDRMRISQGPNGTTFIAGTFQDTLAFGTTTARSQKNSAGQAVTSYFVASLDTQGKPSNIYWPTGTGRSILCDIQFHNNVLYAALSFSGDIVVNGKNYRAKAASDLLLMTFDPNTLTPTVLSVFAGSTSPPFRCKRMQVVQNTSTKLYIAGSWKGNWAQVTPYTASNPEIYLLEFNVQLNKFTKKFASYGTGTRDLSLMDIAVRKTAVGHSIVLMGYCDGGTGQSDFLGTKFPLSPASAFLFVMEIDLGQNKVTWQEEASISQAGIGEIMGYTLAIDPSNKYVYYTGMHDDNVKFRTNAQLSLSSSLSAFRFFVARFDLATQKTTNLYTYPFTADQELRDIKVDTSGNIWITGLHTDIGKFGTIPAPHTGVGENAFLVMLDKNGVPQKGYFATGDKNERGDAIAFSTNGEVLWIGSTNSTTGFSVNNQSVNVSNTNNIFITKIAP